MIVHREAGFVTKQHATLFFLLLGDQALSRAGQKTRTLAFLFTILPRKRCCTGTEKTTIEKLFTKEGGGGGDIVFLDVVGDSSADEGVRVSRLVKVDERRASDPPRRSVRRSQHDAVPVVVEITRVPRVQLGPDKPVPPRQGRARPLPHAAVRVRDRRRPVAWCCSGRRERGDRRVQVCESDVREGMVRRIVREEQAQFSLGRESSSFRLLCLCSLSPKFPTFERERKRVDVPWRTARAVRRSPQRAILERSASRLGPTTS